MLAGRLARWPAFRYDATVRLSLWTGVLVVAGLFGWGAWQRRWIADDGLIVLRTVRNLLAGNGPVFNAGERVEANTSTVWTYLIYLGGLVGGPVRLEYVALVLALVLSVLGVVLAMLGTGRLYAPSLQGRRALLLPAGVLVYIAVPPARDFATSGLENGLVLAYLGLLWWMMVVWAQAPRAYSAPVPPAMARRPGAPVIRREPMRAPAVPPAPRNAVSRFFDGALAFVAGLSVLVRPELALIGGLALIMMLIAARGWRRRALIVAAGGLLPVGYEIFRMGYYGLIFPGTALAKDASGSKWAQGFTYLANLNKPYLLWAPAILLVGLAVVVLVNRGQPWWKRRTSCAGLRMVGAHGATPVGRCAVHARQWTPAGGVLDPSGRRLHARQGVADTAVLSAVAGGGDSRRPARRRTHGSRRGVPVRGRHQRVVAGGGGMVAVGGQLAGHGGRRHPRHLLRHRRRATLLRPGHGQRASDDGRRLPRLPASAGGARRTEQHARRCAAAAVGQLRPMGCGARDTATAPAAERPARTEEDQKGPHTIFFTNLGMTGMTVGLDVRVVDQIGLANPLAAHTARLEDGRIGHDKNLFPDWAVAEGPFLKTYPYIPTYLDEDWIAQAEAALKCPATDAMLNSVRGPMGPRRFLSNLVHAFEFTEYRIDRVPLYELVRCGLEVPASKAAPYTGLPATGP